MKILNLKSVIIQEYTKTFSQKVILSIGRKIPLLLKKLKMLFRGHILLVILTVQKLLARFTKKLQKTNQIEFRVEKVIKTKQNKKKLVNYNGKVIIILLKM